MRAKEVLSQSLALIKITIMKEMLLMKKKMRVMALTLVVAFSLMGAGYAAWGSKVTDTTTIQSGKWSISLENDAADSFTAGDQINTFSTDAGGNYTEYQGTSVDGTKNSADTGATPTYIGGGIRNSSSMDPEVENYVYTVNPILTATTATFGFYNMHPGTSAISRFEIRNKGSIPAKVGNVILDGTPMNTDSSEYQLWNEMNVKCHLYLHTGDGNSAAVELVTPGTTVKGYDGSLAGLDDWMKLTLKDKLLAPNQKISTSSETNSPGTPPYGSELEVNKLVFSIPASALGDEGEHANRGMEAKIIPTLKFNFVQYNKLTN
jgi:hypothetical protein